MASLSILFMGVAQALTNSGGGIEPVAQFHFEGNAEDSSGNGNNGTIIGATFVQGISGQALSFDGVNDYVKTNANINTLPLTIEAWVYPRSITGTGVNNKYIIDNDAGHNAHAIGIDDNRFMIVYHDGGLLSSVELSTNTWYHVAGVWEQGSVKLYVNGTINNSAIFLQGSLNGATSDTTIGEYRWGQPFPRIFDGLIDEVRIYNRALSADEIKADFEKYTPTLTSITVSPPTAYVVKGKTQTFVAEPEDQNGNHMNVPVTWSSSDTNIGTIDPGTGVFTAKAAGMTIVKATSGDISGSTSVIVTPGTPSGFRFVQLTDVHIGPDPSSCNRGNSESKDCLLSLQTSIDKFNIVRDDIIAHKPDFVLITGDLVEWNSAYQYSVFNTLITKFNESHIDVHIVPGNHDRRGKEHPQNILEIACPEILKYDCFNDLNNYRNYIGSNDSSGVYKYEDGDYFEAKNGYRFIGLDSGYDTDFVPEIKQEPNGSGLSTRQKNFVNNSILDDKTVIFMHHPVIDDMCTDNSCNVIAENRDLLVGLAKDKHVKLVLTGHTHRSKFFDSNGRVNVNFRVNVTIPVTNINTFIRIIEPPFPARSPLFIQTRSATKDTLPGYLIVNIEGTSVSKEKIFLDDVRINGSNVTPVTILYLNSPADLHVYDESGRYTGLNAVGEIENNIPDSYYFEEYKVGNTTLPAFALLYNTTLNYSYEIVSNFSRDNVTSDQATFNFTIKQKIQGAITTIKYNNVSINRNSRAYLRINTTQTNYTMQIDLDNDSIIDTTKQPETIKTDYAPTATIISPANSSTWDQGQPVTFNGSGIDNEDGNLNKLTWFSDRDDVIGSGNFTTANFSAGTHNIILLVNDSAGQVNTANIVITVRDTLPPVLNIDYPPENKIFNKQNISISGIAYDDSGILNVTVNGFQAGQENWNAILSLNEGWNIINVTATDNKGFSTIANQTVYYNSSLASDTQPPVAITNLTHKTGLDKSGRAWINWTWDNPKDQDFSYVIVYIDNIHMENTSGSYFSIDGLSKDANYNISILSADIVDNTNYTEVKETVKTPPPDTTPPITTIALSGILGSNDWYISNVQINLSADDYELGTGLAATEFSFDNINWSTYTVPFNISNEGITAIFYRSTDNAGNIESTKHKSIKIDKTPPNISISGVADGSYYNSNVTPVITITDTNLNNQTVALNNAPFTSGNIVSAEGNYTLVASADDSAGNTTTKIVNFAIDKTPPEAAISFNVSSKDIKVYSNETGGEINYIVLPPKKNSDDKKSDDDKENGWELGRYTLKDLAGNLLELVLKHKKEGKEAKAIVISMQYNGGSRIDAAKNEMQVEYSIEKNSSLKELEQKIEVEKKFDAEAKYSLKENNTEIKLKLEGQKEQKENRAGIVIFKLVTNKGGLNLTLKER
ncbi:3',5'-cyclic adenosine monophosphate phosphodiesterase CpdA [uncultured archaeon]|nr:3',5'-cyclic adenosine monophosphate phosphodiesterase CpdA [uncultured archaeon]